MAYSRFQRSRAFRFERYTAGTITLNSTTWANLPGFGTLALEAQVGDVIEAGLQLMYGSEVVFAHLDAVTQVSGTPTNSFGTGGAALTSTTGYGVRGWGAASGIQNPASGPSWYVVQAGDIVAGQVTVRLRYRTDSAANKTAYAAADAGIFFYAKNLGPADPE